MERREYLTAVSAALGGAIGASIPRDRWAGTPPAEDVTCHLGHRPDRFAEISAFAPDAVYGVPEPDLLRDPGDASGLDTFVAEARDTAADGHLFLARRRGPDGGPRHEYRAYGFDGDIYQEVAREESEAYVTAFFPDAREYLVGTPCIERTDPSRNGDI